GITNKPRLPIFYKLTSTAFTKIILLAVMRMAVLLEARAMTMGQFIPVDIFIGGWLFFSRGFSFPLQI
ncbi:MAG: hypothetical protein JWQ14_59, partial [Adhaeribacter sp.]|nr:hypothetical protein [Adhaeribacter sp.]